MACPRVDQHPSIASPVALQLLQGLLSIRFAVDRLIILSYDEEDLTLGLFDRKHARLIQLLPRVPPEVEEAHGPGDVHLHALQERGDGGHDQTPVPEREVVDGVRPVDEDGGCHLLEEAGHGQPDLRAFAHRQHADAWPSDLKHTRKGTHGRPPAEKPCHGPRTGMAGIRTSEVGVLARRVTGFCD